jgi:hypothetical protein
VDNKPPMMTVDRFDVLWFLSMTAFWVLLGADASDIWFANVGVMLVFWFREPLGDWLGERAANKMREQVHNEINL